MNKLRAVFVVLGMVMLSGIYYVVNPSFAHGGMGGMGHGMMGMQEGSKEEPPITANASHAKALLTYIQKQRLQCLQCHAVSKTMVGPSFASVSARYDKKEDAAKILGAHIAHGIGRMPPGFANKDQANELAQLIIRLRESKPTKPNGK